MCAQIALDQEVKQDIDAFSRKMVLISRVCVLWILKNIQIPEKRTEFVPTVGRKGNIDQVVEIDW
jgi:hypothetical protein